MEPNVAATPKPQTTAEPKKSLPKLPLIIAVVILLAVLLTGTYMLGKNQSVSQKPTPKPTATPTSSTPAAIATSVPTITTVPTIAVSPSPELDYTANWKTYTNSANLFTLKYPALFTVTEQIEKENYANNHNEKVDYTYYNLKFSTGKVVNGQPDWSGFGVIVSPTNGRTIDQEYTGQQGMGAPIETTFTKETGGADEAADITNVENGVRVYRAGDKFFEIATFQSANLLPDGSDGITNDLLKNILSTIKFTP
jgi:hypothetical protein